MSEDLQKTIDQTNLDGTNIGPRAGMGDDSGEELQIGERVAGIRADGPKIVE